MLYGSSKNLDVAQKQFCKTTEGIEPRNKKFSHEHPMDIPEMAQKIKDENEKKTQKPVRIYIMHQPAVDPERTKFYCLNWGCGQTFVQVNDGPRACRYHPGVWQFGSYHVNLLFISGILA